MMQNFTDTIAPLFHSAPARKRGRPLGAKSQVVRNARALGIHHFAFVRSSLLGLDLRESFDRYLAWSESTTDLRYVQNRREALLKQIIEAGRHIDATLGPHQKITALLDLLRSDAAVKPALALPSVAEWAQTEGMDPDSWSEAELIAEYKAAFGLDNADAIESAAGLKDPVAERVRALNHLETILAVTPAATDRLESWLARPTAKCLRNVGLLTLGDLVRYINVYGYRWHTRVAGFGVRRASAVLAWLRMQASHLNMSIADTVQEPKSLRALKQKALGALTAYGTQARVPVPPQFSQFGAGTLVQIGLSRIQGSPLLAGDAGEFRSHMANTLGASNDLEAVNAWLAYYKDKVSTQRSYRKEVERFMLWCAQELKKPLSGVTSPDCLTYREFLQAVPASWIHPAPVARTDPQWRAFRGQPGPASQKQALVILQTMFGALCDAGYLVANPMKALLKGFDLPGSKLDIRRSFTEAEWTHVLQCLDQLADGPERVRLKCILELLVTSGIRLDELARARHGHLRLESLPDLPDTWVLTVTGKRNKTRDVPLNPEVVRLLATHGKEFMLEDKTSADSSELPLIRTLHASVAQWGRAEEGALRAVPLSDKTGSALSAAGIYAVLKRFFGQIAKTAGDAGLDARRFDKASTHWMRHTFVRQALVDGLPIEVVSELAGHASIDTTSIYATQELARKIKAVQGMRRRMAS
ncbi:MAG: phage integrase family protein [Burkholderiaceae bacterium]|nr:phage integrase family protein [Burkholderiaceae bacterium]